MGGFTVPNFAGNPASSSSSLPQLPNFTSPSSGPPGGSRYNANPNYRDFTFASGGALPNQNKIRAQPTIDPTLTNDLLNWLHSQVGQGLPAFNQSVNLPSGGTTAPGTLSAPENPILQQLQDFMTGKTGPGSLPGVLPMWQSEMAAMQGPIEQNLANIREQFGSMGALGSSEMAGAQSNYLAQTSADEMALLTSATMSSLPSMLSAGMDVQGIDQSAINRAYQQFMTDLPQNNPMLPDIMSAAFTYPGTYNKPPSFLESLLPALPGAASAAGAGLGAAGVGAGGGASAGLVAALTALCWIASAVFDEDIVTGPRVNLVRNWLINHYEKTKIGSFVVPFYRRHGQFIARCAKHSWMLKALLRRLFDVALRKAKEV